jgi:hypothetical protein
MINININININMNISPIFCNNLKCISVNVVATKTDDNLIELSLINKK